MGDAPNSSREEADSPSHDAEDGPVDDSADVELDDEAQAMIAELSASQEEVQRMLELQKIQAEELGGMRDNLTNELHDLQDEAWKLQLYGELESLKLQLASLQNLEKDMDAAEAILDATEPGTSRSKALPLEVETSSDFKSSAEEGGEEYDPEEMAELQAKLDEELAGMFAQLQAVKSEAAAASARKALLEAELKALLEEQDAEGGNAGGPIDAP